LLMLQLPDRRVDAYLLSKLVFPATPPYAESLLHILPGRRALASHD